MTRISNVISGVTMIVAAAVFFGPQTVAYVKNAYPADVARSEALDRCAAADSHFVRFSAEDRMQCYHITHIAVAQPVVD